MALATILNAWHMPRMTKRYPVIRFTRFKPREAAKLSGLSTDAQRDLRRRGHLAPIDGVQASFTAFDIAAAQIIRTCGERGIGPSLAARLAQHIGPIVVTRLCALDGAVGDETGAMREWMEALNKSQLEFFLERTTPPTTELPHRFAILWSLENDRNIQYGKLKHEEGIVLEFTNDLADAFDKAAATDASSGPTVVFDLDSIARHLALQARTQLGANLINVLWRKRPQLALLLDREARCARSGEQSNGRASYTQRGGRPANCLDENSSRVRS